MRHARTGYAAALLALSVVVAPVAARAAETRLPAESNTPAGLVRAALESELLGPSEVRGELLKQALTQDPNFAPARWQSGFVRWDGQWLTPNEVASRATRDPLLVEYRKRRDAMVDKADDHRDLAVWCQKNKLADESRMHWSKILEFEASDDEALAALGLQWHAGRLLTRAQIEEAKRTAIEQRLAIRRWQPQMIKWRSAIEHGSAKQRGAAVAELGKFSDPMALVAMELVFGVNRETPKAFELNQLLNEAAGRIPTPAATDVLLRRVLIPDSADIRNAAAIELKKRPLFAFVPFLLAALLDPGEMHVRHQFYFLADGGLATRLEYVRQGDHSEYTTSFDVQGNEVTERDAVVRRTRPWGTTWEILTAVDTGMRQQQLHSEHLSERARDALRLTTDFSDSNDPQLWEKQLAEYYSSYHSPYPEYRRGWQNYSYQFARYVVAKAVSCFPAGTAIVTNTGPIVIEKIRIGDRVLAQDPRTGELAYKPVQRVTLRPASPLVKIRTGGETLSSTRGHPFWVNDKGWVMAKHLKVGDLLHTPGGSVVIDELAEAPAREAYNLVVSDFNSYFVGDRQLLVHDNSPLLESNVRVPGLVAENH